MENAQRNRDHYDRASWLSYDVNRMPPARQRAMILALLDGASGGSAALRNILLDPALLGAAWNATIGKFYPDTKSPGTLNIAKMVNAFCQAEYGCHVRDAILDGGKPGGRKFVGDDVAVTEPGQTLPTPPPATPAGIQGQPLTLSQQALAKLYASRGFSLPPADAPQSDLGERPQISRTSREPALPVSPDPVAYDWRRIARAMGDRGWGRYYSQDELDQML